MKKIILIGIFVLSLLFVFGCAGHFGSGDGTALTGEAGKGGGKKGGDSGTTETCSPSFVDLEIGDGHALAIDSEGSLYAWGWNSNGKLGDGTTTDSENPKKVYTGSWDAISAGFSHSVGVAQGKVYTWGSGQNGPLGDGDKSDHLVLSPEVVSDGWQPYATSGVYTSFAVKNDGNLYAWGQNGIGKLGNPSLGDEALVPTMALAGPWKMVSSSDSHTLAIKEDGSLWAWGYNDRGQVGNGENGNWVGTAQQISSGPWKMVSAGGGHSLALMEDGSLYAWGNDNDGQLGLGSEIGTKVIYNTPQLVSVGPWRSVSAGKDHSLGVMEDGVHYAWGANDDGQLGWYGGNVAEPRNFNEGLWQVVAAGKRSSMSIDVDGNIHYWGRVLGSSTGRSANLPVQYTQINCPSNLPSTLSDGESLDSGGSGKGGKGGGKK